MSEYPLNKYQTEFWKTRNIISQLFSESPLAYGKTELAGVAS